MKLSLRMPCVLALIAIGTALGCPAAKADYKPRLFSKPEDVIWTTALKELSEDVQRQLAFRAVFGTEREAEIAIDQETFVYVPQQVLWLDETAVLVALGRNPGASHAGTGWFGVHYLTAGSSGFVPIGNWPSLVSGNGFGGPPSWQLNKDLLNHTVIVVESEYTAQGITTGTVTLVEFQPEGPVVVAELAGSCSNEGFTDDPDKLRTATLSLAPMLYGGGAFAANYMGTHPTSVIYERTGTLFQRTAKSPPAPDCEDF